MAASLVRTTEVQNEFPLRPLEMRSAPSGDFLWQNSQSTFKTEFAKTHFAISNSSVNYSELVQICQAHEVPQILHSYTAMIYRAISMGKIVL